MVALFNAIAKSKQEVEEAQEGPLVASDKKKVKESLNVKEIAKNNFFEMLNKGTSATGKARPKDDGKEAKKWAVLEDAPYVPSHKSAFKVLSLLTIYIILNHCVNLELGQGVG